MRAITSISLLSVCIACMPFVPITSLPNLAYILPVPSARRCCIYRGSLASSHLAQHSFCHLFTIRITLNSLSCASHYLLISPTTSKYVLIRIGPMVLTTPSIRSGDPDHISPDPLNRSSCLIIIGGVTILACLTLGVFSTRNTDDVWLGIQHFNIGRCK